MICKHCGLAIHKCSSANEYHPNDREQYMSELNGSGCIHEPEFRPTPCAADGGDSVEFFAVDVDPAAANT